MYCPEENAEEDDGEGGLRYSDGCFERTSSGGYVRNTNCVSSASQCGQPECTAADIECDASHGTIGGSIGNCICTCDAGYGGDNCGTLTTISAAPSMTPPPPNPQVQCILDGVARGFYTGVYPEKSDIDGRDCPRLGCIDCGGGLPVLGNPPADLGYCPSVGTTESDGEGGTRLSNGCNARTNDGGGIITNINCRATARQCGDCTLADIECDANHGTIGGSTGGNCICTCEAGYEGYNCATPQSEEYYILTDGICGTGAYIEDVDSCENAAAQLQLVDVTVNSNHVKSKSRWPTGCWYNPRNDRLYFNTRSTNKRAKAGRKMVLCYGILPAQ